MIRHLMTLIWNRKRSLIWIFIEQVLVFGVLLTCFTSLVDSIIRHYSKGNIRVDNIVFINISKLDGTKAEEEEKKAYDAQFSNMVESMKDWPSVELTSINRMGAAPVLNDINYDSLRFGEHQYKASIKYCDENYFRIFKLKLSEGKSFQDTDASSETPPALITQRLADKAGLTGSAIGKTIYYQDRNFRIVGVVEAFKDRSNEDPLSVLFIPVSLSTDRNRDWEYLVKYKSAKGADFSKAFFSEFYKNFPRDKYKPELVDLFKFNDQLQFFSLSLQLYLGGIPTAFLVIFAFLGTFGLVWMQSKKRMGELGLRMALGSSPGGLQRTIIMENLMLTTFAMLPGLIVMANLYAFAPKSWEWIAAVGAAIVLMWLFATFSAWYPARKAAKVQPVEALRANQ